MSGTWRSIVLCAVVGAVACDLGGQSGSEGGDPGHCVCEVGWQPGRAVVTALEDTTITLLVDSWVDEAAPVPAGLEAGQSFTAQWAAAYSECGRGVDLSSGDLVVFDAPLGGRASCTGFVDCGENACGSQPEDVPLPESDDDAVGSTPLDDWYECAEEECAAERAACPQDYSASWLRLARWDEPTQVWEFGEGDAPWRITEESLSDSLPRRVPRDADEDDLDWEHPMECESLFPRGPAPCDVIRNGEPDC